ncbi:glycosyltransferase [Actinocatenispora rupis]|uniref:Glycosyl transferase family 1 n=2 Tax=Actinocatenispora rupis TaxID=519421 RepID=A0A8J3NCS4_9ACTN|nr:glycosyl transferase family 1 [Actinocatenispora rupis]
MITHGSRGDVQPFAAAARAAAARGHHVVLAAPAATAGLAEPYCAELVRIHDGPNVLATDTTVVRGLEQKFRGVRGKAQLLQSARKTRRLVALFRADLADLVADLRRRNEIPDVVLYHASVPGHHLADYLGAPSVLMCPQAYWVPNGTFPDPSFPFRVPRVCNRATYVASPAILWTYAGGSAGWRRRQLGLRHRPYGKLRQVDGSPTTVLNAFSRLLLPDGMHYPDDVHTTGFWTLPLADGWRPDRALARFLSAGPPPLYVGFASSVTAEPGALGHLVGAAVREAGARAVVVGGWTGMRPDDLGPDTILVDDVPFDWLFPRVSAVVHHGGLGTLATAMATGRPQVVCPSFPDQWFNARRLHELGVAPEPLARRRLTGDGLVHAVREVLGDPRYAARATELGTDIRAERGAEAAVDVLEKVAAGTAVRGALSRVAVRQRETE